MPFLVNVLGNKKLNKIPKQKCTIFVFVPKELQIFLFSCVVIITKALWSKADGLASWYFTIKNFLQVFLFYTGLNRRFIPHKAHILLIRRIFFEIFSMFLYIENISNLAIQHILHRLGLRWYWKIPKILKNKIAGRRYIYVIGCKWCDSHK